MSPPARTPLQRLLHPASIAVAGGNDAAEVIRQCRRSGFAGEIWAINPKRNEMEGLRCYPDVASLPGSPDAAFIAVPREQTVALVRALAARGAGGAVCYASGFAELDAAGAALQDELVEAGAGMALLGPNCYGLMNWLDGCALWPDRAGGSRVGQGVALLTQSGNIGLNLTLQQRHLPLAYMLALGNKAQIDFEHLIGALLDDARVTAIGLHVESLGDIPAFSAVALRALAKGVPIVALKTGASRLGAELAASHTSALAGPDACYDALFERVGVIRVDEISELLETLKLLHVQARAGRPVLGARLASLSCSGGEASLVADLGEAAGLRFPALPEAVEHALREVLGPQVALANPLDYHTYIWADLPRLTACFGAVFEAPVDAVALVLDIPPAVASDHAAPALPGVASLPPGWRESLQAFVAAQAGSGLPALVLSSMPELMPAAAAEALLAAGIAPMQGLRDALRALRSAAWLAARRRLVAELGPVTPLPALRSATSALLTEVQAKQALAACGLAVPQGGLVGSAVQARALADTLGYPVVVKAVAATLAHKSELGAVRLNLRSPGQVEAAVCELAGGPHAFDAFLVEQMAQGAVAELIIGITRDPQFGFSLTLGAGGVLVELLADTRTLLLPAHRNQLHAALASLRSHALLQGWRGAPAGDIPAVLDAVEAVLRYAQQQADRLIELDINPLIVLPGGAVAVDALIRLAD